MRWKLKYTVIVVKEIYGVMRGVYFVDLNGGWNWIVFFLVVQ